MTSVQASATDFVPARREPFIDFRCVFVLAGKEIRDSLRNRWFILYTIAFVILSLGLSFMSLVGTGMDGFAGFGRTAAGLINLVILIIPLMGLTAGAGSLAAERERGSLGYLLAQPVTRLEVIAGKYLGLAASMLAAIALGFGASAAVIAFKGGEGDAASFARLTGLAFVLALSMLSIGFLISALTRKASVALGGSIFTWLTLVFLGDLGLMGSTIVFKLQAGELFHLSLINPLQVFKMAALDNLHASLDVLGPAGLYAQQTLGAQVSLVFAGVLAAWVVGPLAIAMLIFRWRGAS